MSLTTYQSQSLQEKTTKQSDLKNLVQLDKRIKSLRELYQDALKARRHLNYKLSYQLMNGWTTQLGKYTAKVYKVKGKNVVIARLKDS